MQSYLTRGICAKKIRFKIDNGIVKKVEFKKGCRGNLQGISKLVEGMPVEEVIDRLKGTKCIGDTSCPDQLAIALEEYMNKTT